MEPDDEPEELTYNRCQFQIRFNGSYEETQSGGTTEYDEETTWCFYEASGGFTGNTFEGDHAALGMITGSLTATSYVEGFDIDAQDYIPGFFRVQDEETCAQVSSMHHVSDRPNLHRALVDSTCNEDSYITIRFREE